MKVKRSKNKKTGIMNLKFSNLKTFKISNFSKILDLKKLEIVSNDNYSERLKLDVSDIDVTLNELINNKQVWSILFLNYLMIPLMRIKLFCIYPVKRQEFSLV